MTEIDDAAGRGAPTGTSAGVAGSTPGSTVLTFPLGLPGFPSVRQFQLEPWAGDDTPFSVLRCLDQPLEFLVVDPEIFFPDYDAVIDSDTAATLELESAAEGRVLVIVTVSERAQDATANLLGPIVVNPRVGKAVQAVMADRWGTRHRLIPAV
jgi:flagellar assembly factor FliW